MTGTLEPTTGQQVAWVCFLFGAGVLTYWIVRGVVVTLIIGYAIVADIVSGIWAAHRRGVERLRAYEAKLDR